jgi:hypothetical protein
MLNSYACQHRPQSLHCCIGLLYGMLLPSASPLLFLSILRAITSPRVLC